MDSSDNKQMGVNWDDPSPSVSSIVTVGYSTPCVNLSHSTVGIVSDCSKVLRSHTVSLCRGDGLGQSLSVEWEGMHTWQMADTNPQTEHFGIPNVRLESVSNPGHVYEGVESDTGATVKSSNTCKFASNK